MTCRLLSFPPFLLIKSITGVRLWVGGRLLTPGCAIPIPVQHSSGVRPFGSSHLACGVLSLCGVHRITAIVRLLASLESGRILNSIPVAIRTLKYSGFFLAWFVFEGRLYSAVRLMQSAVRTYLLRVLSALSYALHVLQDSPM